MRVSDFLKKAVISVLVFVSACSLTACDLVVKNHVCDYTTWYLAKAPTCTKNGIMEGVCECGKKTFEEIQATGHSLVGGVCSVCGESGTSGGNSGAGTENKIEPGQVVGLTMQGVYDKFATFGYNVSYQQFLDNISCCELKNVEIDSLGVLHFVLVEGSASADVILPSMKVDFDLSETATLKNISLISIDNNLLNCIFVDGTALCVGSVNGTNDSTQKTIRSIFINEDNVLGVVYSDDTVMAVGKIADMDTAIKGSQLYYKQVDEKNEYKVAGILNLNDTKVEIPLTHLGQPITKIADYAFCENEKITEVVLGENVERIDRGAFYNCSQLTTIKLNEGLEIINICALCNCPKLQRVIIPSTVTICKSNAFYGTNCSIYVDLESKPAGWSDSWNGNNNKVYWKGEWELVNGVPVPLQ